jgi:flagella basal body P-ring formation protein FlgA
MVRRGKMVLLIGESKRLLIKTQGKALENGRLGDVIKVKNITSGKVVHATVTGENTVKVDL